MGRILTQESLFNLRVYIEDTDAGGIVYYVNYLKYMERGRTEFFRGIGVNKPAMPERDILMVVVSADIKYQRSAQLDDDLVVRTRIVKVARTYIVFEQCIFRSRECLTTGLIKIACVNAQSFKPVIIPGDVLELIRARPAATAQ